MQEDHIRTVMLSNAFKWKIYRWGTKFWACRTDGYMVALFEEHHIRDHIKSIEGQVFVHDKWLDSSPFEVVLPDWGD